MTDEKSRALPTRYYRDPSETVRYPSETSCKGCRHELRMAGELVCLIGRPHGKRCRCYKKEN